MTLHIQYDIEQLVVVELRLMTEQVGASLEPHIGLN